MTYADALLHIDSYPTPTTAGAIDEAVALAASLGSRITALAIEVEIPVRSNRLADYLIGLSAMTEAEEAKSRAACRDGLAAFERSADAKEIAHASVLTRDIHYEVADHAARVARTYDLCLLPLAGEFDGQVEVAQAVVFSSDRPMLIFHKGETASLANGPDLVVIAWDGSRNAARAMADAMPILVRAKRVRLLTILNDKPDATATLGPDAQRHLRAHGIEAAIESVDREGAEIGKTLDKYIAQYAPDLLVMGAYGHSRAREFLLGGATEHTLNHSRCPVLLSH
jgi:nucleotide-binding universal stress UspA family protein